MEVGEIPGEACWSTCTSTTLPREADVGTSTGRVTRRGGGGERRRRREEEEEERAIYYRSQIHFANPSHTEQGHPTATQL